MLRQVIKLYWLMKSRRGRTAIAFTAVITASFFVSLIITTATRADDHLLYSPDELAAILRHASPVSPPRDATNKVADDPRASKLGQFLFFDTRLSSKGRFSCASCHHADRAFTDGRKVAEAIAVGTRNTPTLLNAANGQWFFLDGRADTMWAQVLQVIENPREFDGDRLAVAHTIVADPALRQAYEEVFGKLPPLSDLVRFPPHASPTGVEHSPSKRAWEEMSEVDKDAVNRVFSNVGKAIAAYERRLVSHQSAFDRYAKALRTGDVAGQTMLPPAAKRGLKLFVGAGRCELCHSGPDFTDGQFHNVGLPILAAAEADDGRESGIASLLSNPFNAAGRYSDQPGGQRAQRLKFLPSLQAVRGAFKTPTLRNVALTGPYFHDGRFDTLEQVVKFYADGKAGTGGRIVGTREGTLNLIPQFTSGEIADLVAFLRTLNNPPLPEALRTPPATP
jgi:cytochrome c peroxidase